MTEYFNYVCSHCGTHHLKTLFKLNDPCQGLNNCHGKLIEPIDGRAHSETQKRQIIEAIYEAWVKKPDQRLGQFLENSLYNRSTLISLFYCEDSVLVDCANKFTE